MKHDHKFALISVECLIATLACRYIWEYVDPWLGFILTVGFAYCLITLFYKLLK